MMSENTDHGLCSLARIPCCVAQDDHWWVLIGRCDVWEFWFKKHIQLQTKCRYHKWSYMSLYLYILLMKNRINITYNKKDRFRLALSSSSKEVIGQLDALGGGVPYFLILFFHKYCVFHTRQLTLVREILLTKLRCVQCDATQCSAFWVVHSHQIKRTVITDALWPHHFVGDT